MGVKIQHMSEGAIKYFCECGCEIISYAHAGQSKIKKVEKCSQCMKKAKLKKDMFMEVEE